MENKRRLAFVVPRYGEEVNGGAELYCRQLAEKLSLIYDIEVLTTCAIDYITWKNEYDEGCVLRNNVTIRRFKVLEERDADTFNQFSGHIVNQNHTIIDEFNWMKLQGPYSIELLHYIKTNKQLYDFIFFIPYLYFVTYFGINLAGNKSILIPAAHDEPFIYFKIFKEMFQNVKGLIYLTEEEKALVNSIFNNQYIPSIILGSGVDVPIHFNGNLFRKKFNIFEPFMIYIGRIDESKGCKELFEYFIKYKSNYNEPLKLVLLGKPVMDIPVHSDIISLGFVSEEDKFNGIDAAEALVLPSKYESLSLVVLESFKLKKPVLVNGQCDVLRGHCIKSNGGFYYNNYLEFQTLSRLLLSNKQLNKKLGENGFNYIKENFDWSILIEKFDRYLKQLINK